MRIWWVKISRFVRIVVRTRHWRIMLEKVADSARKAVKLAEPYKPYGGQFLEFCSISLSTYQTCMKLTRKSTEFCQFFCRHYPQRPSTHTWIEIELADFLYNWRGEYDFLLLRQHGNSQGQKKCPVDSEGSDGSEIWIPILTNRTCP